MIANATAQTAPSFLPMPLWRRFWLLFTAIWVVVSLLHVLTLAMADGEPQQERLTTLVLLTVLAPAALYGIGRLWESLTRRGRDKD